jgi:hypothetical protein
MPIVRRGQLVSSGTINADLVLDPHCVGSHYADFQDGS